MQSEVIEKTEQESPLDAFRRSAGFQIMFVLHSGLEIGKAVDHLCTSAEKFSAAQHAWQPIESAPKTGERILIGHANSVWEDEWWNGDEANWVECVNQPSGFRGKHRGEVPSHWMPLPDPPTTEQEKKTT